MTPAERDILQALFAGVAVAIGALVAAPLILSLLGLIP